jgi:hypothetical protein
MRVHRASGNDIPLAVLNNQSLNQVFVGGQLVLNPDFDSGTTSWTSTDSSSTATSGILTNTGSGTAVDPFIGQNYSGNFQGQSFYIAGKVRTLSTLTTSIGLFNRSLNQFAIQTSPLQNTWYNLSQKYTEDGTTFGIRVRHIYASTANANGSQMQVDYAYLYNLTSLGIATLTKSQLDYLFTVWQFNTLNALVARQFIQEA